MATVTHQISTASTANTTSYATGSFTPSASELQVSLVMASATVAAGTMTSTGQTLGGWTQIGAGALVGGGADTIYLFVSNALTADTTAMTAVFDCTGDAATGAVVFVAGVTGVTLTGSSAVRQSVFLSNQAGPTTPAVTFASACLTTNPVLGIVGEEGVNPAAITEPTGWTEGGDTGYQTPVIGAEYAFISSGHSSATVTWGSSVSVYGVAALELDATVGVPTQTRGKPMRRKVVHRA